jgi:polyisoprenoid-binding protein YceI
MTATVSTATSVSRTVGEHEVPLAGTYAIDASHTHVGFVVRHLMLSKTRGRFPAVSGTVVIGENPFDSSVDVSIETAGVESGDETRDGHLRSPDFFDVEQFPAMTYRSTSVDAVAPDRFVVEGELTIRDVTRPVRLQVAFDGGVTDPWGNTRAGFTASAEIDRDDFGLTWNQVLEGGGFLVGKKVTIEIEAEAVLQP